MARPRRAWYCRSGARLFAADESARRILHAIPSTGEKLPVIGLGSALTFDVRDRSPAAQTVADVLARFVRRGGRVLDTSPAYGNAESLVAISPTRLA